MQNNYRRGFAAATHRIRKSLFPPTVIIMIVLSAFIPIDPAYAAPAARLGEDALSLIGTADAGEAGGAVFVDSKGVQTFYRLHEKLPDGSEVVKVWSRHVLIKKSDGLLYDLFVGYDTTTALPYTGVPSGAGPALTPR